MSKDYGDADKKLLEAVGNALFGAYYLSLSTEEPTKADSHEVDGTNYARIKWDGPKESYTWPSMTYFSNATVRVRGKHWWNRAKTVSLAEYIKSVEYKGYSIGIKRDLRND